jgi:hypothetical protein
MIAGNYYQSQAISQEQQLTGIGGWLILPIIGLSVSILGSIIAIFAVVILMLGFEEFLDSYTSLLQFEAAVNVLIGIGSIVALILLCMKKKILPGFMIGLILLTLVFVLFDAILAYSNGMDISSMIFGIVRSFLVAAIWIPYFLVSKRVKNTFIN